MTAAPFLFATSYPPVWVLLTLLAAMVIALAGFLTVLTAFFAVLFRPSGNPLRRTACRWGRWLSASCLLLVLAGVAGEAADRHLPFSTALIRDDWELLAGALALVLLSGVVTWLEWPRKSHG